MIERRLTSGGMLARRCTHGAWTDREEGRPGPTGPPRPLACCGKTVAHTSASPEVSSGRDWVPLAVGTEHALAKCQDDRAVVLQCPRCGSDRLIPLPFTRVEPDDDVHLGQSAPLQHPIMQCLTCARRLYVRDIMHVQPKPNRPSDFHDARGGRP